MNNLPNSKIVSLEQHNLNDLEHDSSKRIKDTIVPKHIKSPAKVYTENLTRTKTLIWENPEWDLAETGRILDVESIVRRAFKVKRNLFLKEGYEFTGNNVERILYIKERIQQIEHATGISFPALMSNIVSSLIRCSNSFLVKVRDKNRSGGKIRQLGGKTLEPVAGYFSIPAETVRFKRSANGSIEKYKQVVNGKDEKEFNPEDVIHFFLNKRDGFSVGTPDLVSVKDDIRALRRIEENLEMLIYQHLFPLFHYKVGTPEAPADILADGSSEIDTVRIAIQSMPTDGCWITPERHEIKVLGAQGQALGVDKAIAHFKQRVFAGLGVSSVDMGEGDSSNRSTAQTMSRILIDDTKADQRDLGSQVYSFIIEELLLESTFNQEDIFSEENKVFLKFKEIDLESRIAKENHYADLYLKNLITHSEARIGMGYKPFIGNGWQTRSINGDYDNTYYGLFERDRILLQSIDEPGTTESKAALSSTTNKNNAQAENLKKESPTGSIENKNRPTNQYGVRVAPKLNKDFVQIPSLFYIYNQNLPLEEIYSSLKDDLRKIIINRGLSFLDIGTLIGISFEEAKKRLFNLAKRAYRSGVYDTGIDYLLTNISLADHNIEKHVNHYVYKLRDELISLIKQKTIKNYNLRYEDAIIVDSILNSLTYRSKLIDEAEILKAYNYGLASGYAISGYNKLYSERSNLNSEIKECNICDKQSLNYNQLDVIIYEDLPPLHPRCTCLLKRG